MATIIFIFADPDKLELGKVFSTIALLGYVFNFSILYSNYAIEAIYTIKVFNQRVDQIVVRAQDFSKNGGERHQASSTTQGVVYEQTTGKAELKFDDVDVIWSSMEWRETQVPVVKDISFHFENNDKVALIGKVGSGKSTLLNAILKEALSNE